ncbi:MAG: hypothetical protein WBD40_08595 [Tepidisphaeraceae bacterium]
MQTWDDIRPILVKAYELIGESYGGSLDGQEFAGACGREQADPRWERDIEALVDAGYLTAYFSPEGPDSVGGTEKGRQETQGWPGPRTDAGAAELLVAILDRLADDEEASEYEREKARGVVGALREAGVDFAAKVVGELGYRASGLG